MRCRNLILRLAQVALFVAFSICARSSNAQFAPAKGLENEKLDARATLATVSQESEEALHSKGYALIGTLDLSEKVGKHCWGAGCDSSLNCTSNAGPTDVTRKLLKQAATHGGDVVILSQDNRVEKHSDQKQGKCTSWTEQEKYVQYQKCTSAGRDPTTGTYQTGTCTLEGGFRTVKECAYRETIAGQYCVVASAGTVWRLDPDLPKRVAEREKIAAAESKARDERAAAETKAEEENAELRFKDAEFVRGGEPVPSDRYWFVENRKFGYRDEKWNVVIPARFENIYIPDHLDELWGKFSDGRAAVGSGEYGQQKWGYIDEKGEMVIPLQFDKARPFSEGMAAVAVGKPFEEHRWGYIDAAGKWAIPPKFYDAADFSDGLAPVEIGDLLKHKWGYINRDGAVVINPSFDSALSFSQGLAAVQSANNKWGYINKDGVVVVRPAFDAAWRFSEGLARVELHKKYGYVDQTGKLVVKPVFDEGDAFSEGLAKVQVQGKYGYIDPMGKFVIQPQFEDASAFNNGVARVVAGKVRGSIDKYGKFTPTGQSPAPAPAGARVTAVAGVPGDTRSFFFGADTGALWKTTDGGNSWAPLGFDNKPASAINDIALAGSNPDTIYLATFQGVYKSTDGGKGWKNVGPGHRGYLTGLVVHPRNPDIVFTAALDSRLLPSESECGVYRTLDGGMAWQRVLFKDKNCDDIDIALDTHHPNVLFVAAQSISSPEFKAALDLADLYNPRIGYIDLYKSTDGGTTWRLLQGTGLPQSISGGGGIGVTVSGSDSNRMYALIGAEKRGLLYVSDDGGDHWRLVNSDQRLLKSDWHVIKIVPDPQAADTVYVLHSSLFRSTDGGRTFTVVTTPHGDSHALWIDPTEPQSMIHGDERGVAITTDGGKTWAKEKN